MPFIHISSLPFEREFDTAGALKSVSETFSRNHGIALEHITATWNILPAGHYAQAAQLASFQPDSTHPILVDFLLPDIHASEAVAAMLETLARQIARVSGVQADNVFVNARFAHSGLVWDRGRLVCWRDD